MTDVSFGWLIRSVHRWSASMMVLMLILHVFRVYLTGGFKRPRELTWVTGVTMAVITVSFWRYRLLAPLGSSGLLGSQNCFWSACRHSSCR